MARFLTFILCMYVSSLTFGQDKPFEGALYYRYGSSLENGKWGNSDTIKLIFSRKRILYDSLNIRGSYMKGILDPSDFGAYALYYKDTLKKGFKIQLKNMIENAKVEMAKHKGDTSTENLNPLDNIIVIQVPSKRKKQIAGMEASENKLKLIKIGEKDTLKASIYLNYSLGIKLADYDLLFQGFNTVSKMRGKMFVDCYEILKNGIPVEIKLTAPNENSLPRMELIKVERTNKYEPLFDISQCKFEIMDKLPSSNSDSEELH